MGKRYVLWFAHEHVDFRHSEMESILSLFNIDLKFVERPSDDILYWIVELDSEETAKKIASRSISLRWCFELWGKSDTIEGLHGNMKRTLSTNSRDWSDKYLTTDKDRIQSTTCPRFIMEKYFNSNIKFRMSVETFCRHFTSTEKVQKIEGFNYMPFEGPVQLKNPDVDIMFLEYYGLDPNNIPQLPFAVFIGRRVADGQRNLINKLSLKCRKFIGNTSMDPQLSLLMANQAQVSKGDIVLDPFVGSGSLLVAAAEFGGYVWGSDIDYLMLHARSRPSRVSQKTREKDESIRRNMEQYNTENQYLDVVVSDFSLPLWKDSLKVDAIITDPPYGVRESTEKIGIMKENYTLAPEHMSNHIPSKIDYNLTQIFDDLLSFAAKHLNMGRRLVCWFPYFREEYTDEVLPRHEKLQLIGNSEHVLSKTSARRLLTYERVLE